MNDLGLANERTALSWQRTALSLVAAAAVVARLTVDRLGSVALIVMAGAMLPALWLAVESVRRYEMRRPGSASKRPSRRTGWLAPTLITLITVVIAGTELVALLLK